MDEREEEETNGINGGGESGASIKLYIQKIFIKIGQHEL
jgi:hypothetical protein